MYTLYLDETGDWGYPNYDPSRPVLCLCGSIFLDEYYNREIVPRLRVIKRSHFHDADIILHRYKVMTRQGKFSVLKDDEHTRSFVAEFSNYIAGLDVQIIVASLDKIKHYQMYGRNRVDNWLPEDVYSLLFTFIVERFVAFLWAQNKGEDKIVVESRGLKEDNNIQYWYSTLLRNGTQFYHNWRFQKVLPTAIEFRRKENNIAGIEISDWIASPMAKTVMYPDGSHDEFGEWELYKKKIWLGQNPFSPGQVGFKTFPDNLGRKLLNTPLKSP